MVSDMNDNTSIYKNDIDMYIHMFFEGKTEDDIKNESQSRWLACMMFIYNSLFKHDKKYKHDSKSIIDIHDIDTIETLLYQFYYYSLVYNKEISLFAFSIMTGLDREQLIDVYGNRLRHGANNIIKMTNEFRHESLKSLLLQGGKTQFGATVILNHDYDYNLPGSNRDVVERRQLNKSEIAGQLGITLDSNELLPDGSGK